MENDTIKTYVENPIINLAYENIRHIQNMMRRKLDAQQDVASLLLAIPSDILKEDKDEINNIFVGLQNEWDRINNLKQPKTKYQWSRRHLYEWKMNQYIPYRDAAYKTLVNIVVNRLHKAFSISSMGMGNEV